MNLNKFIDVSMHTKQILDSLLQFERSKDLQQCVPLLGEIYTKKWHTLNYAEMTLIPWYTVKDGTQKFEEIGMLEWIYHTKPVYPPEKLSFTTPVRNAYMR